MLLQYVKHLVDHCTKRNQPRYGRGQLTKTE
jgi:hypothetical protein